jgi:DNA polymerase
VIITLDFETYYDADYMLKKMTTEAYIRDPRFEALLVGVKFNDEPAEWWPAAHLKTIDWSQRTFLCHHAQFDGLILSHHFGIKPKRWLCTLSMARYLHGQRDSLSLANLAVKYGLREKTIDYDDFKGKRLKDMGADSLQRLGVGCARDCDTTYDLFVAMAQEFPKIEYRAIDTTIRMFTEPKLVGDTQLFADIRDREFLSKNERMYALGVGESDLQSAARFTELLEAEGVEIEYKEGSAGPIPAIAKTDSFMRALLEDSDEKVAALAQARLDVRSTIDETRAGRLHDMSARGPMAVYLNYCGAHTRRWSGGDAVNFQNLPRQHRLRTGLRAPSGYLIAAPDQSQGECRILNWLAGQEDVVERFRQGHDPYLPIASKFYGRELTRDDTTERGTGKQLELSCGFGCGGAKFQITAGRGTYGPPVQMTLMQAADAVELYRETHRDVVNLWREGEWAIGQLARGATFNWRIFHGDKGRLYHPNGTWLDYTRLEWSGVTREWRLHGRHGWSKLYGAKLVENVVQWLSRIVTMDAMARFEDTELMSVVGMSHDDVWLLIPFNGIWDLCDPRYDLRLWKERIIEIMRQVPNWAPGLPLDADCKIGETYS